MALSVECVKATGVARLRPSCETVRGAADLA